MQFKAPTDYSLFKHRRDSLLAMVLEASPFTGPSLFLTIADFESARIPFRQDSFFYYFTGILEPGGIGCFPVAGPSTIYLPKFWDQRLRWVTPSIKLADDPQHFCVDELRALGNAESAYCFHPFFKESQYISFIADMNAFIQAGGRIYACIPQEGFGILFFERLAQWIPGFKEALFDVTEYAARVRREKDSYELTMIHSAVQLTMLAHEQAAAMIAPGVFEYQVQSVIDYAFSCTAAARPAFPSIVATGHNATILHYSMLSSKLNNGDLVVVDVGAEYGNYAADLSRTYPVNGKFTERQRFLYDAVLAVQTYVASIARPGMYVYHKDYPENSLHHIAIKCFKEYGLEQYFCHGIGHFLGLDVHDVGNVQEPLASGDVFTLEPGVYIPDESCGIRIEDDFVMTEDGCFCLSDKLVRTADDIELLMQSGKIS